MIIHLNLNADDSDDEDDYDDEEEYYSSEEEDIPNTPLQRLDTVPQDVICAIC